jgi:hypothetical protein
LEKTKGRVSPTLPHISDRVKGGTKNKNWIELTYYKNISTAFYDSVFLKSCSKSFTLCLQFLRQINNLKSSKFKKKINFSGTLSAFSNKLDFTSINNIHQFNNCDYNKNFCVNNNLTRSSSDVNLNRLQKEERREIIIFYITFLKQTATRPELEQTLLRLSLA